MYLDTLGLHICQDLCCPENRSGAAHVEFHHLDHAANLQVVAAAVEGQTLANEADDPVKAPCLHTNTLNVTCLPAPCPCHCQNFSQ